MSPRQQMKFMLDSVFTFVKQVSWQKSFAILEEDNVYFLSITHYYVVWSIDVQGITVHLLYMWVGEKYAEKKRYEGKQRLYESIYVQVVCNIKPKLHTGGP